MIEVRPAGTKLGAEIVGADVRHLDSDALRAIDSAFLQHGVIAIRGQQLEVADYMRFCQYFGVLRAHINRSRRHPEIPELMLLDNLATLGKLADPRMVKGGAVWHSDLGYEQEPAKATSLYSIHIPSTGGDTLFKNMYAAYDEMPADLKSKIEGKKALFNYGGRTKKNLHLLDKSEHERPPAMHDLVRVHPETGRKALYPSPNQILGIVGMSAEESEETVNKVLEYITGTEEDYRHQWQLGDLVMWDNRCVLHRATGDYPVHERRLHWRVTIMPPAWQPAQAASA